ncbi:MAG: Slp/YeaY family lipoprotein [Pseudomonadota bacterium]
MHYVNETVTKLAVVVAVLVAITGCASNIPAGISEPPEHSFDIDRAGANIEKAMGVQVRWGGVIKTVENRRSDTWIEVIGRPLGANGRPGDGKSPGRFWAMVEGFAEPADFPEGLKVTVFGSVVGTTTENIGKYPYKYVIVDVEQIHGWAEPEPRYVESPYYSPWYWHDPWYPSGSGFYYFSRFHRDW